MIHYWDAAAGPELLILINMERSSVEFSLPEGRSWLRLLDTQRWFDFADPENSEDFFDAEGVDAQVSHNISLDMPELIETGTYGVSDSSIVVLTAAASSK
jgi:hypothetical protein